MALYFIKDTTLTSIADAIRAKTGDSASIPVADFASEIESIAVGEGGESGSGSTAAMQIITASGEFNTADVGTGLQTITHGLGVKPDLVIVFLSKYNDFAVNGQYNTWVYSSDKLNIGDFCVCCGLAWQNGSGISPFTTGFSISSGNSDGFLPNSTYKWVAMALIEAEGSTSGDHIVTFMSEDGSTLLGRKAVMDGDTCGDPVSSGLIETPTKESSVQYDYSFAGWSTTAGGEAENDALSNITGDRTVYAAFVETTRSYTINFYDGDDNTLLTTMTCEYGTTPSYVPEDKDGYTFAGWNTDIVPVTGDADYYAQWSSLSVLIVPSITISGNYIENFGTYVHTVPADNCTEQIVRDKTYKIIFDGVEYVDTARNVTGYDAGGASVKLYPCLGDPSMRPKIGANNYVTYPEDSLTGEPFLIVNSSSTDSVVLYCTTGTSHTFEIYRISE